MLPIGSIEYDVTYRTLQAAGEGHSLPADDMRLLADAAWWLGMISECLGLTETLHQRYLAEGRVDRAALHAIDLGGLWFMRGEHALASGWLSRGRRLLEGQPRGPAHGYLAYLEISGALEEQRLDEATAGARDLQRLGAELGDETFTALGLLCEGLAEIRRGHLRNGFGLLDEAMLPVVAERVSPDWAGHIYCTIVTTCIDLMDVSRAREWARNTERWVEQFSDAVMFVGVCRAHRVQLLAIEGAWTAAEGEAAQVTADLADMNVAAVAEVEYQLGEMCRIRGVPGRASAHFARAAQLGRDPQPGAALLQLSAGEAVGCVVRGQRGGRRGRCQPVLGCQAAARPGADRARDRSPPVGGGGSGPARADPGDLQDARLRGLGRRGPWRGAPRRWTSGQGGAAAGARRRQHRTLGATYDAAVADTLLGAAHRALGDDESARRCADAANAVFVRLGVPPVVAAVPTEQALPGGLTRREVEVLMKIATGSSNREAAAVLHISEATVRRHLANIFVKLKVESRTAAAAWAHDHGLVGRARP